MDTTPQTNVKTEAAPRKFRPIGSLYGMIVGGLVGASWSSPSGNPGLVAMVASTGAVLGAIGGHLLTSRLKPNRTMING